MAWSLADLFLRNIAKRAEAAVAVLQNDAVASTKHTALPCLRAIHAVNGREFRGTESNPDERSPALNAIQR
jgi:hypothetical protein